MSANESDALEQRRPLTPHFYEVRNEPYADEPRYLDGWYWADDPEGREAAQNLLDELNFAYQLGFKHASSHEDRPND